MCFYSIAHYRFQHVMVIFNRCVYFNDCVARSKWCLSKWNLLKAAFSWSSSYRIHKLMSNLSPLLPCHITLVYRNGHLDNTANLEYFLRRIGKLHKIMALPLQSKRMRPVLTCNNTTSFFINSPFVVNGRPFVFSRLNLKWKVIHRWQMFSKTWEYICFILSKLVAILTKLMAIKRLKLNTTMQWDQR